MELEDSKEFKAAKDLEDVINSLSFNPQRFAAAIPTFHRTLQQSLMRLVVEIIITLSNQGTDGRNERAVALAKKLREVIEQDDNQYLPMI